MQNNALFLRTGIPWSSSYELNPRGPLDARLLEHTDRNSFYNVAAKQLLFYSTTNYNLD